MKSKPLLYILVLIAGIVGCGAPEGEIVEEKEIAYVWHTEDGSSRFYEGIVNKDGSVSLKDGKPLKLDINIPSFLSCPLGEDFSGIIDSSEIWINGKLITTIPKTWQPFDKEKKYHWIDFRLQGMASKPEHGRYFWPRDKTNTK